ncbi:hypothetical protein GCM10023156_53870 [Novipirellula rosea]|uniref:DUF1207 domain-containing protein n=1 Tax=Novipirellula rosea TaxID=1031540 RepID=A0ABP8NH73_9BACT
MLLLGTATESTRGSDLSLSPLSLASYAEEPSAIELPWSEPRGDDSLSLSDPSGLLEQDDLPADLLPSSLAPSQVHSSHHPSRSQLSRSQPRHDWTILPEGLLYKSYLAGPHEPRISTVIFSDTENGVLWDATLGGRVGLLRYGTPGAVAPQGWQWDLEGAVMVRLDVKNSEDVESMDFRFGTLITRADGPWSAKFGYFHISSHVGDEYMERFPLFERVNYVTESLIIGASYQASEPLRVYGELAYAVKTSGGAKPIQIQMGAEHIPVPLQPQRGGPFSAINLDIREAVDFSPTMTLQTGWQWQGMTSQRRIRFGLQYLNGYTTQFEFFDKREEQIGIGSWFDY